MKGISLFLLGALITWIGTTFVTIPKPADYVSKPEFITKAVAQDNRIQRLDDLKADKDDVVEIKNSICVIQQDVKTLLSRGK